MSSSGSFRTSFPVKEFGRTIRIAANITFRFFPVVLNHATTGHKLQEKSLDAMVICEWSGVKNWAYVVLSRVQTLKGLFLTTEIPANINFEPDPMYKGMMARLWKKISVNSCHLDRMIAKLPPL